MNLLLTLMLWTPLAPSGLTAETANVNRGELLGGPILKQTFKITNSSSDAIEITGLESTCGCLRRTVSRKNLPAGASADVQMEVNTLTQPDGPQTWRLKVRYRAASLKENEPDESLELSVSAKLKREVSVSPPMISVSTDSSATTRITLTDRREKPLRIKTVAATSAHITTKFEGKPGSYTIELTISDALKSGTHDERILITTDDAHYDELQIPARIVKRDKNTVNAFPETLELEESGKGIVQFRRHDGKAVEIKDVKSSESKLSLTASKGSGPVATIKVGAGGVSGEGQATITVVFAEPAGAERTVIVRWSE